jgi:hypothetical protein
VGGSVDFEAEPELAAVVEGPKGSERLQERKASFASSATKLEIPSRRKQMSNITRV